MPYPKQYYADHHAEIMQKLSSNVKAWREAHKDEKYTCVCGSTVTRIHLYIHKTTKKHNDYLRRQQEAQLAAQEPIQEPTLVA